MSVLNFNSKQCADIRRQLDAYLSNELLVETTSEVLRHLEGCEACAHELEARTRVRDALRSAALSQVPREELLPSIQQQLRKMQPDRLLGLRRLSWAAAFAMVMVVILAGTFEGTRIIHGRRLVNGILALGVSDHVQCAINGHNYPNVANPPEVLRQKLGPEFAGLLDVVQQNLPGFEVLEAHVCSIPGSPRKYVHFITRGRGTILSVILTRREGEQFPNGVALKAGVAGDMNLYQARLEDENAVGFETRDFWGFVVSDLGDDAVLQIAEHLAQPLKDAIDSLPVHATLEIAPYLPSGRRRISSRPSRSRAFKL
jgi:hypothetical protein